MIDRSPSPNDDHLPHDRAAARSEDYEICTEQTDRSAWHPKVREFYKFWLSLRRPGSLPGRQHVDPLAIPALLPSLWIFDLQREPFRCRVRLMGTRMVEILGLDSTGKWVDEIHRNSSSLPRLMRRWEFTMEAKVATYSKDRAGLFPDKDHLGVETVLVPLARDGETVDMIMGISWIISLTGRRL